MPNTIIKDTIIEDFDTSWYKWTVPEEMMEKYRANTSQKINTLVDNKIDELIGYIYSDIKDKYIIFFLWLDWTYASTTSILPTWSIRDVWHHSYLLTSPVRVVWHHYYQAECCVKKYSCYLQGQVTEWGLISSKYDCFYYISSHDFLATRSIFWW